MWTENGKTYNKAVTFSYDDGIESDKRLTQIFNYYKVRCTFNLNSAIIGEKNSWLHKDFTVRRMQLEDVMSTYSGHEIASHGSRHLAPTDLSDEELTAEFRDDLDKLEKMFGVRPVGMAYAYGAYNDKVVDYLKNLGIRYARTVEESLNCDIQQDLLRFKPTCHHNNEKLFDIADEFLAYDGPDDKVFYVWGHSYEFGGDDNWDRIEKLCDMVAGRDDILYATNAQALLHYDA